MKFIKTVSTVAMSILLLSGCSSVHSFESDLESPIKNISLDINENWEKTNVYGFENIYKNNECYLIDNSFDSVESILKNETSESLTKKAFHNDDSTKSVSIQGIEFYSQKSVGYPFPELFKEEHEAEQFIRAFVNKDTVELINLTFICSSNASWNDVNINY